MISPNPTGKARARGRDRLEQQLNRTQSRHPLGTTLVESEGVAENFALGSVVNFQNNLQGLTSIEQLYLFAANEVVKLTAARQSFVFSWDDKLKLEGVTGIPKVDRAVPLLSEIEQTLRYLARTGKLNGQHEFSMENQTDEVSSSIASYPFKHLLWMPISRRGGAPFGGMLLARETSWDANHKLVLGQLAANIGYTWQFLKQGADIAPPVQRPFWKSGKVFYVLALLAIGSMAIPVSMKSLAPFEIVAFEPVVISSPLEGVIDSVLVEPGQPVEVGQALLKFSDIELKNSVEIARNDVEVSRARLKKANQLAFESTDGRNELGLAIAELSLKEARYKLAKEQSERAVVQSSKSGVAVYQDRQALIGKPVAVGQELMSIANPENVEVKINLPVSDSILLEDGARVKLFLDSDPLIPREAIVEYANYRATPQPNGELAYVVTAKLADVGNFIPRLGIQGSAQLYGKTVPLFMYLFRRPITSIRQWTGW